MTIYVNTAVVKRNYKNITIDGTVKLSLIAKGKLSRLKTQVIGG